MRTLHLLAAATCTSLTLFIACTEGPTSTGGDGGDGGVATDGGGGTNAGGNNVGGTATGTNTGGTGATGPGPGGSGPGPGGAGPGGAGPGGGGTGGGGGDSCVDACNYIDTCTTMECGMAVLDVMDCVSQCQADPMGFMPDLILTLNCAMDLMPALCADAGFAAGCPMGCAAPGGAIGEACVMDTDCTAPSANVQSFCITPMDIPGGYCTAIGCTVDADCGAGNFCIEVDPNNMIFACLDGCVGNGDCRAAEGYTCIQDPVSMNTVCFQ